MRPAVCLLAIMGAAMMASCARDLGPAHPRTPSEAYQAHVVSLRKSPGRLSPHEIYQQRVQYLREAVELGDFSVAEGEVLRQGAYRDYLTDVKAVTLAREGRRNW